MFSGKLSLKNHSFARFWNFTFYSVIETWIQRYTCIDSGDPHDQKVRFFYNRAFFVG